MATPDLAEYRQFLVAAEQKAQEDFDKAILSLSGGALGISFVFLKDVIGDKPVLAHFFLLAAWVLWAVSSLSVLLSFHLSHLALRKAIEQVDDGTIRQSTPGGGLALATAILNAAGAVLFSLGVVSITIFASHNLVEKGEGSVAKNPNTAASQSAAPTAKASCPDPG